MTNLMQNIFPAKVGKRDLFNIEAEQILLGGLLGDNNRFYKIMDLISEDDFYDGLHQELFSIIRNKILAGEVVTPVLLKDFQFKAEKEHGVAVYALKLLGFASGVISLNDYAKDIRRYAQLRKLKEVNESALTMLEKDDMLNIAEFMQKGMTELWGKSGNYQTLREKDVLRQIEEKLTKKQIAYSTGFNALDVSMQGGLQAGRLYVFPAYVGTGKTTMMTSISNNLRKNRIKHSFVAAEMSPDDIALKMVASENNIAADDIKDFGMVIKWFDTNNDTIIFEDSPRIKLDALVGTIKSQVERFGIKGFFLDYMQLVSGAAKNESVVQHLENVAQTLAELCKKEKIFCVTAVQMNRDDDLRNGDGILQACEWMYILRLIESSNQELKEYWLECKKNRHGKPWNIGKAGVPKFKMINGTHFMEIQ